MIKVIFIVVLLVTSYQLPATSLAQTPTPPTKEENAVYKTSQATIPESAIRTEESIQKDASLWNQFYARALGLLKPFKDKLFKLPPVYDVKLYAESSSLGKGNLPQEVLPKEKEGNVIENIKGYLGGDGRGFYGISSAASPSSELEKVESYEKLRERSFYPEGIRPITGN